jgi:hypothetical protein
MASAVDKGKRRDKKCITIYIVPPKGDIKIALTHYRMFRTNSRNMDKLQVYL